MTGSPAVSISNNPIQLGIPPGPNVTISLAASAVSISNGFPLVIITRQVGTGPQERLFLGNMHYARLHEIFNIYRDAGYEVKTGKLPAPLPGHEYVANQCINLGFN